MQRLREVFNANIVGVPQIRDVLPELLLKGFQESFRGEVRPATIRVMQILGNGGLEVSRCWVHKTANVLNKLPKCQQSKAKRAPQEIWMAETKKDTLAAFDAFIETWGVKYDNCFQCSAGKS